MKKLLQIIQFLFIYISFNILKLLPINAVSFIGGLLFQKLGPLSKTHNTAINNYKKIFNNLSEEKITQDVKKSWKNLGKTFIEFSILKRIINHKSKIKIIGESHLKKILKDNEQVIFFGIHQANWELIVPIIDNIIVIIFNEGDICETIQTVISVAIHIDNSIITLV